MEHGVAHPPMIMVPMPWCYYYPPPCVPQETSVPPELTPVLPRRCAPEEDRESRTTPAEEEVHRLLNEAYGHPGMWRCLEERLWVRATPLQTMESCYAEHESGEYVIWGSAIDDFERVLSCFSFGFVYFDLVGMEARVISQDQAWATLQGLKFALRHLRAYPALIGFVALETGRRCFLEAAWTDAKKVPVKDRLEQELVLAVVRTRRQTPISFW